MDDKLRLTLTAKSEVDSAMKQARAQIRQLERDMIEVNKELDKPGNPQRWEQLRAQMQDAQADMVRLKAESGQLRKEMAEATAPAVAANKRLQTSFDALMRKMGMTGGAATRMSTALGRMSEGAAAFRTKWTAGLAGVQTKLDKFSAQVSDSKLMSGLGVGLRAIGPWAGLAGAGVAAMGVKTAAGLEQSRIAFTQMMGSADKAGEMVQWLSDTAAKTPFELEGLTSASQKLLAFGFDADSAKTTLMSIGDAAAASGKGAEGVDRITTAIGQMQAKQKLSGEEMMQLTEAGIPAWQILADKMGTTVPHLQDMAQSAGGAAKLFGKGALPALIDGMGEKYSGMMDKQSQSLAGLWSTLMDTVSMGAAKMIQQNMPQIKAALTALISGAGAAFEKVSGAIRVMGAVLGPLLRFIVDNKEAVAAFVGTLLAGAAAFKVLQVATMAFNVVMGILNGTMALNPVGAIVVAIAALVAGLVYAYRHVDWFKTAVDAAWAAIKKAVAVFVNWFKAWVLPAIKLYLHAMGVYFRTIWTVVKFVFRVVVGVIKVAWGAIRNVFSAIGGVIRGPLATAWRFISTSAKSSWDRVRSVFAAARGMVTGVINGIKSALSNIWHGLTDGLASAVQTVKDTLSRLPGVGHLIPGLWTGGPAAAGQRYMVGEIGPELYVPRTGAPKMIGVHGPEILSFPTAGFVVPSFALASMPDSAVPTVVASGAVRGSDGASAGLPGVHIDRIDAREDPELIVRRIEAAQRRAARIAAERAS